MTDWADKLVQSQDKALERRENDPRWEGRETSCELRARIIREDCIPRERVEAKIRELQALASEPNRLLPGAVTGIVASLGDLAELLDDEVQGG